MEKKLSDVLKKRFPTAREVQVVDISGKTFFRREFLLFPMMYTTCSSYLFSQADAEQCSKLSLFHQNLKELAL